MKKPYDVAQDMPSEASSAQLGGAGEAMARNQKPTLRRSRRKGGEGGVRCEGGPAVHWVTFAEASPVMVLNSLLAFLRIYRKTISRVTLLKQPAGVPSDSGLAARAKTLLASHGCQPAVEWVELDNTSPCPFARELEALLTNTRPEDGAWVIDLSPPLPSFIPAMVAQLSSKHPQLSLFCLLGNSSLPPSTPLLLTPRLSTNTLILSGAEMSESGFPMAVAPLPIPSPQALRTSWSFSAEKLMLLVNALLDLGYDRNVTLNLPLLKGLTACRVQFQPTRVLIQDLVEHDEYQGTINRLLKNQEKRIRAQIPAYGDLSQLLYAAGILIPGGVSALLDEIAHAASHPVDKGGDVFHLALDTNLLRDRFFTTFLSRLTLSPNMDFILCETVREELMSRDSKMTKKILKQMAPLMKQELLTELFFNQNQLDDRFRYLGLLEFNRMKARTGCREQDSPRSTTSSVRNDRMILDAYSSFVSPGCKVLFLSRDQEAVRMMRGEEGVISLPLEHEHIPKGPLTADWDVFLTWVYLLAVAYGRVEWRIGGTPVAVTDGVWAGKSIDQWEQDHLRVSLVRPQGADDREDYEQLKTMLNFECDCLDCFPAGGDVE